MSNLSLAINRAKADARETLGLVKRKKNTPVDVYAVAKALKIKIAEPAIFKNDEMSGFLKQEPGGQAEIVVNATHSPLRQRFTIAHEIGHFRLHANESVHVDDNTTAQPVFFRDAESSKATKLKEIEANQFAAELLMPSGEIRELVLEKIQNNTPFDEAVAELAGTYEVSTAAMAIKIGG